MQQTVSLSGLLGSEPISARTDLETNLNASSSNVDYISEALQLFATDQAPTPPPQQTESQPELSSHHGLWTKPKRQDAEQRQQANREHQRKFRIRTKARSQAVQTQLASTIAELKELKFHYQQLQTVLHKLTNADAAIQTPGTHLNASQVSSPADIQANVDNTCGTYYVSLRSRCCCMSATEVVELSTTQFYTLWKAYVEELARQLIQLARGEASALRQMYTLTVEAMRLLCRRILHSPTTFLDVITSIANKGVSAYPPDSVFSPSVLAMMNLSKEQVDDLQQVRRMYIAKHRLLTFKRQALARLASEEVLGPQHGVKAGLELIAAAKDITCQEYEVKYVAGVALWSGILATLQLSVAMVHYPYWPLLPAFWDAFGQAFGQAEDVAAIQGLVDDPVLIARTWASLVSYVKALETEKYTWGEYVPLSRHNNLSVGAVNPIATASGSLSL